MNRQKYSKILLLCLVLCLVSTMTAWAVVEPPPAVYVGDYADVLSTDTEQLIIKENERLEAATGAQIVVVTVDFLDGMEIEDYAYTIFNDWGIGDAEENNGLLLLLVIGEENYWAMQGDGIYRALTSSLLDEYLYGYLEADFAVGDYDAGVAKVFEALVTWYDNYYQLQDGGLPSAGVVSGNNSTEVNYVPDNTHTDKDSDGLSILTILIIFVVLLIIVAIIKRNKDMENKKNGSYRNYRDYDDYDDRNFPNMSGGSMMGGGTRPYYNPRGSIFGGSGSSRRTRTSTPSFGGGKTRGGGAGRSSASGLGKSIGRSIGSSVGRSFGGGRTRGGGAGRR